jgi:tRNA(Ile)-lysidine synthase
VSGPKPAPEPRADPVDLPAWLAARLDSMLPGSRDGWVVAFSGGVDSLALLAALQRLRASRPARGRVSLRAIHLDHGLNPRSAQWARACRVACRALGVPLTVHRLQLAPGRGVSVESAARDARYARLRGSLRRGEVLLTAHHLDDQLETILLQLLRGAGVNGLAAMPELAVFGQGLHLRPLLSLERRQLAAWARTQDLAWIDDDSNADRRFDRNYLRHEVLPRLLARWPAAARVAARSAAHLADARQLLADLAAIDLAVLQHGGSLEIAALARLSAARRRNAVRAWLAGQGLPVPDTRHLARILGELCEARHDAAPMVAWRGAEVRRYRGWLHASAPPWAAAVDEVREWRWSRARPLRLGAGLGTLVLRRDPLGPLDGAALPTTLRVRFRVGGERLCSEPGGPRRAVKELLRVAGVLPWMRPRLPLLFDGERLVAVADLLVDATFGARPGTRRRYRLEWRDAPAIRAESPTPRA